MRRSRDTRISCARRSGSLATMARLAASAAASDGGGAVENTKGRPRWTRYSIAHEGPATKAPPTPSAFPAVLIETNTSRAIPCASIKPLPRAP